MSPKPPLLDKRTRTVIESITRRNQVTPQRGIGNLILLAETTSALSTEPEDEVEDDDTTEEMMVLSPSVHAHSSRSVDDSDNDYIPIFSESPKKKKKHHTREEVETLELDQSTPAAVHSKKDRHRHHGHEESQEESPAMRFLQTLLSNLTDHNHTHETQPADIKQHSPHVETVDTTPHKKKRRATKEETSDDASFTSKVSSSFPVLSLVRFDQADSRYQRYCS